MEQIECEFKSLTVESELTWKIIMRIENANFETTSFLLRSNNDSDHFRKESSAIRAGVVL